jgi:hypothetical protein
MWYVDEHFEGMPSPPPNLEDRHRHLEGFIKTQSGTCQMNRRLLGMS